MTTQTELDKMLADLDAAAAQAKNDKIVQAAHKTVDTFAGIVGRKLWLINGSNAQTDGNQIEVPMRDDHMYQLTEHELAHILFDSNLTAKKKFADGYAEQIEKALAAGGTPLDNHRRGVLLQFLHLMVNVLEDHRVNSLWALLYPGSYVQIRQIGQEMLRGVAKKADRDLLTFMLALAYDLDVPSGELDRLRPIIVAALKRVERKGPAATFIVSKWLVSQMVTEIIRSLRGMPPPPDAGRAAIEVELSEAEQAPQGDGSGADGEGEGEGDEEDSAEGGVTGDDSDDAEDSEEGGGSDDEEDSEDANGEESPTNEGESKPNAPRQPEWQAQQVAASTSERAAAFQKLIDAAAAHQEYRKTTAMMNWLDNLKEGKFPNPAKARDGEQMARMGLEASVNDTDKIDIQLARSEGKMQERIEEIRRQLEAERERDQDEWILRNAGAKVTLKDIPTMPKVALEPEALETVQRLRQLFQRVKSRRKKTLYDTGSEIDVPAYITNQMNGTNDPMFKDEGNGRGFKCLVLVDRSGSMQGTRTEQVEEATHILRRSLSVPNVEFHVWGFQTTDEGVLLTRINRMSDLQTTPLTPVTGATPLHIAMQTAVNWLQDGTEKKQLVVLTDGLPNHSSAKGRSYGQQTLLEGIGLQTKRAQRMGINVTGLAVGSEVTPAAMRTMFGSQRNWSRLSERRMGTDMVKVVTSSFQRYLADG